MKRTGRAPWRRSTFGGLSSSSPPVGDRMKSQPGQENDVPIPMVVSDILPPAASYQSAPPIETPVPIPVPMRMPTSTTTTTTAAPGLAAKPNTMAANKNIMQAQKDWEKKQTKVEDQGKQCGSWCLRCLPFAFASAGRTGQGEKGWDELSQWSVQSEPNLLQQSIHLTVSPSLPVLFLCCCWLLLTFTLVQVLPKNDVPRPMRICQKHQQGVNRQRYPRHHLKPN